MSTITDNYPTIITKDLVGQLSTIFLFEGEFGLVVPFAGEEREVFLVTEGVGEGDAGTELGGGGSVTRAVGTGLDDMHHATTTFGVSADIERVCSHQNAAHRINARVKLYLGHVFCENVKELKS